MPTFTVTDPSTGRTVTLQGDSAPTEQELEQVFSNLPSATQPAPATEQPAPAASYNPANAMNAFIAGGKLSPETLRAIEANTVRYGVPIAATLAASRLGSLAGIATGGISGYASELAAQKIQGEDLDQRKALAMGILNMTPFKGTGSLVSRLAVNIPSALATSETARYIENPEAYAAPSMSDGAMNTISRLVPGAFAGAITSAGKLGSVFSSAGKQAQAIREGSQLAQQEFGVTMGRAPLLQDLFGGTATSGSSGGFISNLVEPAAIERAAIQRANPKALEAMENALIGPSEGFAALSRSAPDLFPLTEEVRKNIGVLEPIYQAAKKSRDEATVLTQQAQDLQIKGMAGASEALDLARAARLKAYADETVYNLNWRKVLGAKTPSIKQVSIGERNAAVAKAGEAATDARELVVSEAYKKAGIGENDPIVSIDEILATADKEITANASRAEFKAAIKDAFGLSDSDVMSYSALAEIDRRLGISGVTKAPIILDRTTFLESRNKLAAAITKNNPNIKPSLATRKANQFYDTMKKASESFIEKNMPDKLKPYLEAQARASRFFDIADTDAFKLLQKGDAKGFYDAAKETGASVNSVYDQAMQFVTALRQEGAPAVADGLEASINNTIREGVLDSVINKGTGFRGARIVRAPELVKQLQTLQESGFPVHKLGLGKVDDIRSLARIASSSGNTGYTINELNNLLDDAEKLGLDRANAKLNYQRAVRNSFLETDPALRLKEAQKMRVNARKAGLDAQQQEAIAKQMESDSLIKFLNEPGSVTNMGILNDPAKNADIVETLSSLEPTMVSRFMDSLRSSGRVSQAEDLEKATIARMFGKFGKGSEVIDLASVLDPFRNPANQGTLTFLKAILGKQRYDLLKDNLVTPLDRLAKSYERANQPLPNSFYQLRSAAVAGSLASGQSFSQSIKGSFIGANALRGAFEALQNKQYNVLYKMFIDPKTAPMFANIGYNVDKIAQQPVLSTMLKLEAEKDAKSQ